MKRVLILTLAAVLAFSLVAMGAEGPAYEDGSYVWMIENEHGHVVVEVVIEFGAIADVNILNPVKTPEYSYEPGRMAFLAYPQMVLEQQSVENIEAVDVLAGATHSVEGYNEAVQKCLDIASGKYDGDVYYGLAKDWGHGHNLMEVHVKGGVVTDVSFVKPAISAEEGSRLQPDKTEGYPYEPGVEAYENYPEIAVEKQDPAKIDVVSGATGSYTKYNAAFAHALEQANIK
ncbi:MAG: FMN-binding protein [Halanaerobium sp.]|nr:FMN-binding protein [Halanaerobium sp.]